MQLSFPKDPVLNLWGDPEKQPLLFLHANSYSAKLYQSFLNPLTEHFQIWAPDLPGHGESRWNGRIQAWSDLADYFIDKFDQAPPRKPLIGMGHSIGGIVIMLIALKRPEWFSKIVMLDPVMLPKRILIAMRILKLLSLTHLIPLAKATKRRKSNFPSRELALEHYAKKSVFSHWKPGILQTYVDTCLHETGDGTVQLSCAPQLESSIYQSIPLNVWSIPKRLNVSALFLIGEHSDTVSAHGFSRLRKIKGNHVVNRIKGGHLFPFEKPEESIAQIKDFLVDEN